MSRREAIKAIVDTWLAYDNEFCAGKDEKERSRNDLIDCLVALGVTADEVPARVPDKLIERAKEADVQA